MNKELNDIVEAALYVEIEKYEDGKSIVMNPDTNKLYYKKELEVYSIAVFKFLKSHAYKHLPKIQIFWEEDDKLVVIEEFIQGKTLDKYLAEKPDISFEERKKIILEVCDGLIFLHNAFPPIIHRDIKESNIMIREDGSVVILDFDAAKQFVASKNKDTVLIGTVGSAAPEQYGFAQSDERTDIYAVGKLMENVFPKGRHIREIIEKATKLDPAMRFSSVSQLKNHIEKLWDPAISEKDHIKMEVKRRTHTRRFKMSVMVVLLSVLLLFGGFVFYSLIYPEFFLRRPAYDRGVKEMESGNYEEAKKEFELYPEYKDSKSLAEECERHIQDKKIRSQAESCVEEYRNDKTSENAERALIVISELKEKGLDGEALYNEFIAELENDTDQLILQNKAKAYFAATALYEVMGKYGYFGAEEGKNKVVYSQAESKYNEGDYDDAEKLFKSIDYKDSQDRALESRYKYGNKLISNKDYEKAIEVFESLGNYNDAQERIKFAKYSYCDNKKNVADSKTREFIEELKSSGYPGAEELSEIIYAWHLNVYVTPDYRKKTYGYEITVGGILRGGRPGESVDIKMKITMDNGVTYEYVFEDRNSIGNNKITKFIVYNGTEGLEGHSVRVVFTDENGNELQTVNETF